MDSTSIHHIKRNWMSIYYDRIGKINANRDVKLKVVTGGLSNATSTNMVALRLLRTMRKRINKRIVPVQQLQSKKVSVRCLDNNDNVRLAFCAICLRPGLAGIIQCSTCCDIYHIDCLENLNQMSFEERNFNCELCREKDPVILEDIKKIVYERTGKEKNAAVFISTWALRKLNRSRTRLQNKSSSIITNFFRLLASRQRFQRWRRQLLRPSIIHFEPPTRNIKFQLWTLSLMDSFKRTQLYRIDRYNSTGNFSEKNTVAIPGLTGEMTIVLTLSAEKVFHGVKVFIPLFQATIPLKDIRNFVNLSINLDINFREKISWNIPYTGPTYVILTSIFQPEFSKAEGFPVKLFKKNNFVNNVISSKKKLIDELQFINTDSTRCSVSMSIFPLFQAFCGTIQAPTVEVLRQQINSNHHLSSRSRYFWANFIGNYLNLYESYGSPYPLIRCDLKDSLLSHVVNPQTKKKSQSIIVSFPRVDIKWVLTFQNCGDASRFVSVFFEQKYRQGVFNAPGLAENNSANTHHDCGAQCPVVSYS